MGQRTRPRSPRHGGRGRGSRWTHLGVFEDNDAAIALYQSLGFEFSGEPGPDMILVG